MLGTMGNFFSFFSLVFVFFNVTLRDTRKNTCLRTEAGLSTKGSPSRPASSGSRTNKTRAHPMRSRHQTEVSEMKPPILIETAFWKQCFHLSMVALSVCILRCRFLLLPLDFNLWSVGTNFRSGAEGQEEDACYFA